ncbi:flavin-containing monooxygenase [Mycobacteroides abscessus]|uniref:flavin-containing monooxygenase n=1 Tax=Mycobacteroides abscessus TaxID=36809 RepID=UPI000925C1C4|nr:NAD(P)/FAD-dependent oxidoreductase [Mycobacteroides abscessus]SHQ89082.1 monooxygenase [Mycobacteroides abscessus subsp. bolletii]SHR73928.1 monooxygenase [Mycobacteroides abscessus subsp. bolletii]SHT17211.1 monooxygenase [Mycobacteroides abscessus subsp. bolletii]SKG05575.1 monooxygenase [Mycobacteroides abscessus subsp. bolletii]SKG72305.1 monooxygenase [Mycobacteroides abscessus subsp. bolletii]
MKAYADFIVDKYRLRPHLELGMDVTKREWDERRHLWRLELADGTVITSRYVITAVGVFTDPKVPDIKGLSRFTGKVIQTQDWDWSCNLAGKRIGVIGTGATSVQMIPEVAKSAGTLYVFQRSATWVFPKPDFRIPRLARTVFRRFPFSMRALRGLVSAVYGLAIYGVTIHGARYPLLSRLPAWALQAYLWTQVREPGLRRRLTPEYQFGCKRPSISNTYYSTFTKPHVELVTDRIVEITAQGIRTADNKERKLDVLVLATGFQTFSDPEVYRRRPVIGRDDFDLADFYERHRLEAYEGVSLPLLPNPFSIFGPFSWSGGAWHEMVETQALHITRVLTQARRRGATAVSVTPESNERFSRFVRAKAATSLVQTGCAGSGTYYLDHHGEFSLLRPTTSAQARHAARIFPVDDYAYETLAHSVTYHPDLS